MLEKDLDILIEYLRDDGFRRDETIKILYTLKAWQVLSKSVITTESLCFRSSMDKEYVINSFNSLAVEFQVFKLFNSTIELKKISNHSLEFVIEYINTTKNIFKLTDAIRYSLDKEYGYLVSAQLLEFSVKLADTSFSDIYTPFRNSFEIAYYTNQRVYAESYFDELSVEIIKIVDGLDIEFNHTNTLETPSYIADSQLREFDCSVSFPPFGQKTNKELFRNDSYNRFKVYQGKGSLDIAYFEHILLQTRRKAVILMPVGFTFRGGAEEKFREYLIEKNWLESIIQLPANLHSDTAIETTFFIINKYKSSDTVYFLNLRDKQFITKDGRKQVLNKLDNIIDLYKNKVEKKNISTVVLNSIIKQYNYSLSVDRYILSNEDIEFKKILNSYNKRPLKEIAEVRKSQLIQDEENGDFQLYEVSPSDFKAFDFILESGKQKNIKEQYQKYETYKLMPNDILISTKGTIGKVAIVGKIQKPLIASQNIHVIRIKDKSVIEPRVLYMFFKSNIGQRLLKQLSTGTTMPQITTKEINELAIPIIDKKKQQDIIEQFEYEIELYKEIEQLQHKINTIHHTLLED